MVCATKKTVSRMAGLHLHSRIVTVGACSACGEPCLRCKFPFEHFQITWEIVNSSMIAALLPIAPASGTKWEWMSVSPVNVCQERALLEMVTIKKKVYQNNNGARKKYSLQFGFIYHWGLFFSNFFPECFKAFLSLPAPQSSGDLSYRSLVPQLLMCWSLLMS